ncbi:alpha-L-fucosidase [Planctomycetota bacterium]
MAQMTKQYLAMVLAATVMLVAAAQTKAQDAEESEAAKLNIPGKFLLRGQRTTHPDAQWFPDAGLGLFMHWGVNSAHPETGSSWSTRIYDEKPAWLDEPYRRPEEFWELADKWNPEKYEPDKWMKAAKAAGFNYAVLTAKPHLGYAIWPSQHGEMNTRVHMNGRDLITPYLEACRNNDMKAGFYFSGSDWYYDREYINWYFGQSEESRERKGRIIFNYKHERVDKLPERPEGWSEKRTKFLRGQISELLRDFGKIDIWWWDSGAPFSTEEIRELQPGILVNNRGGRYGDYVTPETFGQFRYEYIKNARENGWWIELCELWSQGGWFYQNDIEGEKLKNTGWVLYSLARCRCWDSNLLLNVAPRPDGQMPQEFYDKCAEMAEWMKHSGKSVYGITGGGPYPEKSNVPITIKGDVINDTWYLHPDYRRQTWDEPIVVKDVEKPATVKLLRTGESLDYSYDDRTLTILIPKSKRTDLTDVVAVKFSWQMF